MVPINNTKRLDNGDVWIGDSPFSTMGGRWVAGKTTSQNWDGWYQWRAHDGRIKAPMDNWPSDAVLGPKVAKALGAWLEAKSDHDLAKSERDAANSPDAMKRAEQRDIQRIVDIAKDGGDHAAAADETPNVDKLKRNRRVYAGNVVKAEGPMREALKVLLAVLNDESLQHAAAERAVKLKREADAKVAEAEALLNAAKAKAAKAGHDLRYAAEWADVSAHEVLDQQ